MSQHQQLTENSSSSSPTSKPSSSTTQQEDDDQMIKAPHVSEDDHHAVNKQVIMQEEQEPHIVEPITSSPTNNHHTQPIYSINDGEEIGEKKEINTDMDITIQQQYNKQSLVSGGVGNDQTPESSSEGILIKPSHGSFLSFEQLVEEEANALLYDDNTLEEMESDNVNNNEEKKSPQTPNSSLVNMMDFSTILSNSEKLLSTRKDDEEEEEEEEEEPISTKPIPLQAKIIHTKSEGNLDTFITRRNRTETYPSTPTLLKQRIMQKYKQQIQQQSSFATDTDTDDDMLLTSMSQNRYFRLFSLMIAKFFRIQSRVIAPNGSSPQSIEAIRKQEKANRTIQRDMLTMFISGFSMFGIFAIIWYNIYFNTDVLKNILEGRDNLTERFYFTMKCIFVSSWIFPLVFVAIVRNRLFEEASNPLLTNLINKEHQLRITIHQRVLQNSIEQFIMHSMGCLILGYYVSRENLRIIVFASITFLLCRIFFWIGYTIHHSLRTLGMLTNACTTIAMLCFSTYYITTQDILPFIINDIILPIFVIFSA